MSAYFDTSAFLKLLLPESGSATVMRVWQAAIYALGASVLYAEAAAGLAAAHRAGRVTARDHLGLKRKLWEYWADLDVVLPDEPLCEAAGGLAERHKLRGYDAVHLAAALRCSADTLVCGDGDLLDAGRGCGLLVIDARN